MAKLAVDSDDVARAAGAIAAGISRTPTVSHAALSEALGCEVHLKLETLQRTGSFKARGSLNRLLALSPAERKAGVLAASAGNHAQGVAYHAGRLGIPASIVMPEGTAFAKIRRTEAYGAEVILFGESVADSAVRAAEIAAKRGAVMVHPYDDPLIIAGQGTLALELLEDAPDLDGLIVPVGGGGLIAGIAVAAKAQSPGIEVIGVEAEQYPSMYEAIHGLAPSSAGQTLADGIAVKRPGALTRPIVEALVADILLVGEAEIERAVDLLATLPKVVAEGAGAVPVAALLAQGARFKGRRLGLVISGGNIDRRLLASVLMRALVREGQVVRLRIEIPDQPGRLSGAAGLIGRFGGNIIEIHHQRLFQDVPVKLAELDVVVETRDPGHVRELIAALEEAGYPTRRLRITREDETAREG
ncbi:MAG: threonine ammonia-lyase [Proteobacteria bacterium]|nr:threonine ammonia-lyase [Pseudomonadota bacterium]